MEIAYPSIHFDLAETTYRQENAINYSTIKAFDKDLSPRHYFAKHLNPARPEPFLTHPPSQAMINGTALHAKVQRPQLFEEMYALAPTRDKRTTKWSTFVAENPHKTVLRACDWDSVHFMAKSVAAHPSASYLLSEGSPEVALFWIDEVTNERCKALVDWLRSDIIW